MPDSQSTSEDHYREYSSLAWLVWGLAAAYFFADYFARVSPGVMTAQLQQAFDVSAAGLGSLSAFFYYPYLLMQIPVGLIVDRKSIRGILTVMALLTALGCIVFGLADHLYVGFVGRLLIGFSAAFAFVSALRLAAAWFPASRLGLLAGLTQALGMLGAAVGEAPVSLMVSSIGWRETMGVMASVFVVLAVLIYRYIQDRPPHQRAQVKHPSLQLSIGLSLKYVLSNPRTWYNACFAGLVFAPTAVIGEFWGPAFLQFGRGFSAHAAAFANGLIFIGWGIGGPLTGWLSDRLGKRKPLMMASAGCGLLITSILIFTPSLSYWHICILLFLYGLTNTGVSLAYAVSTEINPYRVVGASIAFTNMSSVIIGASLLPVVGKLMDSYAYRHHMQDTVLAQMGLNAFQHGLWVLPLCSMLALVCCFFIKETYCRPMK